MSGNMNWPQRRIFFNFHNICPGLRSVSGSFKYMQEGKKGKSIKEGRIDRSSIYGGSGKNENWIKHADMSMYIYARPIPRIKYPYYEQHKVRTTYTTSDDSQKRLVRRYTVHTSTYLTYSSRRAAPRKPDEHDPTFSILELLQLPSVRLR